MKAKTIKAVLRKKINEVIEKLKAKDKDRAESAYLLEIIDRVF